MYVYMDVDVDEDVDVVGRVDIKKAENEQGDLFLSLTNHERKAMEKKSIDSLANSSLNNPQRYSPAPCGNVSFVTGKQVRRRLSGRV